jgi:hypothetical protein
MVFGDAGLIDRYLDPPVIANYTNRGSTGGFTKEGKKLSLQVQASNLTDHLNVISFASLFSGTTLTAPRSCGVRLKMDF